MEARLYRRALLLSYLTVFYNLAEGAVCVTLGLLRGSVALVGFGLDSFIETLSGCVMIWRLGKHGLVAQEEEDRSERLATRLVGVTFFILAADVAYEAVSRLVSAEPPARTAFGIAIAAFSIVTMVPLFLAKYRTGRRIGSRSLVADSKETLACAVLSVVLLVGLGANYLFGLWWTDPVAGLVIAAYLARKGWETLSGEDDD